MTENTTLSTRYSIRQEDIDLPGTDCDTLDLTTADSSLNSLCEQVGGRISSIFGYTFGWDRRNDPITPTRGFDVRFSQDLAGIGGDVKYLRTDFQANAYRGLFKDVIANVSLSGGYIRGWGGDPVSINDRYFKGNFDFRGFDNAGICLLYTSPSPRDATLSRMPSSA